MPYDEGLAERLKKVVGDNPYYAREKNVWRYWLDVIR